MQGERAGPRILVFATLVGALAVQALPGAHAAPRGSLGAPPVPGRVAEPAPGTWSEAALPPNPDGRMHAQMAYAPELHLLILFGGFTERGTDNDVYWLDVLDPAAGWRALPPTGGGPEPAPRGFAAVAWDPARHRMVVFGGIKDVEAVGESLLFGRNFLNDVWALVFDPSAEKPPRWEQLAAATDDPVRAPSKRAAASGVYDPVAGRLVVFGGNDTVKGYAGLVGDVAEDWTGQRVLKQGLNDVWAFDLSGTGGWTVLDRGGPLGEGPDLLGHQAAYDPANRQLVVTGGAYGSAGFDYRYNRDTYSFDLETGRWSPPWYTEGTPPAMVGGAYGYASELGALVVARGQVEWNGDVDPKPVYALKLGPAGQGAAWMALPSKGAPHRVLPGVAGTVVGGGTLAMFGGVIQWGSGGYVDDATLSAFDLSEARWRTVIPQSEAMVATAEATGVHDSHRNHMLVVGGRRRAGNVWDLDLRSGAWRRFGGGFAQEGSTGPAAAYDSARRRLLVVSRREVLALDPAEGGGWSRVAALGDAPDLVSAEAVYDPVRDRLLLVGGRFDEPLYDYYFGAGQLLDYSNQVFALHLSGSPAWREVRPAGSAPERVRAAAAYDAARDRVLLFGGSSASVRTGDLFELDLRAGPDGTWRRVTTSGTPPSARDDAVAAVDSANDRLLVWGGRLDDPGVYALDLSTRAWSKQVTSGDPVARVGAAGVYDPVAKRMVVHGGYGERGDEGTVGSRDTHGLALGGTQEAPPVTPAPQTHTPPAPSPVRGGTWTGLGPRGARTVPVALSPAFAADRTVFAGTIGQPKTENDAGGVYVSRDAGATWQPAGGDVGGAAVLRIEPAPSDPRRVYAAARGRSSGVGVYASDDTGTTWRAPSEGLPPGTYYALAVHPSDPDVAWAAAEEGGPFVTTDGGRTWAPSDAGMAGQWVYGLAAVPLPTGVRLLAAARDPSSSVHGAGRVFVSDDLGASWDLVLQDDDYVTYMFAADPSDRRRVLLSAGNGVWRSEDGGLTWEQLAHKAIQAAWLAFDPTSGGQVVYAAGVALAINFHGLAGGEVSPAQTPGLFRSTDGGVSWQRVGGTPEEDFGGVAVGPDGRLVFAGRLDTGVYVSTNGGGSFSPSSKGFMQSVAASVGVDAADPNRLVAAAHYEGAYLSRDGGATWESSGVPGENGKEPFWYAAASPAKAGRVLAGNYSTLYKSETGGLTWSKVTIGDSTNYPGTYYKQAGGFAFHPTDPATWWVTLSYGEVAATRDNGKTFEIATPTGYGSCLIPIAANPGAPDELLVGDVCGRGVYLSRDGGRSWAVSNQGLDDRSVTALAYNPADPSEVFAGTMHEGVYRSTDGGRTWAPARLGVGYRYVKFLAVDAAGRVFAAVHLAGVYESDDRGATWTPVLDGLLSRNVLHVTDDRRGGLLAATSGLGVLRLQPGP